jgi:hypothetical protein
MEQLIPLNDAVEVTLPREIQLIRKFLKEEEKAQNTEGEINGTDTKTLH